MYYKKKLNIRVLALTLAFLLVAPLIFQPEFKSTLAATTNANLEVIVTNDENGVLGKTKTVTVTMKNKNLSDWIYNVGLEVELGSGLEIDKSEIAPNSITENGKNQILIWKDIKDLAPGESFSFTFDVLIKEEHRGTVDENGDKVSVNFGDNVWGKVTLKGSSDPQTFDNLKSEEKPFSFKVVPFEVILSEGGKLLKGAGETSDSGDDKYRKDMAITIINNSKYPATIDLTNTIANGVQVSDVNQSPTSQALYNSTDGKSTLNWSSISLGQGVTSTIKYKVAIFDKTTLDGNVNSDTVIDDGTSLAIELSYSGKITLNDTVYSGNTWKNLIAKDIILDKSINYTGPISYGTEFTYTLTATVNQYHDIGDIEIIDTLGDGQEFQDSYNNTGYKIKNDSFTVDGFNKTGLGQGKTELKWTMSNSGVHGQFKKGQSYSLDFKAKVKEKWHDDKDIVAGDSFVNNATISGTNMTTIDKPSDSDSVHTHIPLPKISKTVISVNDNTSFEEENNRVKANIGDVVKFEVTYDASNIGVKQKEVEIVDIFPQGTTVNINEGKIVYSSNWPSGEGNTSNFNTASDPNALRWKFTELPKNTKLTVEYEATVKNEPANTNAKQTFNLAKMAVKNTANIINSDRAEVGLTYTEPILGITKTASKTSSLIGGEEVTFTITLNNTGLGTAYNVEVSDLLPDELELVEGQTGITVDADNNKKLNFTTINSIEANSTLTITYKAKVIASIGSGRSFKNAATIEKYKNRNDSSPETREYVTNPSSSSVTMTAAKPTITMSVEEPKTSYKVGDEVIYKLVVTIPTNTTAYNGYIEVDIPNKDSTENQEVIYVSTTKNNESGTITYTKTEVQSGYDIKWDTVTPASGELVYYVKTTIKGPNALNATEVQTGKAIFNWYDKSDGGEKHSSNKTNDVSVEVKLPQLATSIGSDKTNIVKDDEITLTFNVSNIGGNTAHNFTPTVVVPPGFTISGISHSGTYSGDTNNGGTITFQMVDILEPGESNKLTYTFEAKLDVLQPAGSEKQFTGHSGEYWTNIGSTGVKFSSISSNTTVTMPSVNLDQEIIATSRPGWITSSNYIRPGDTVDYKITVTVPKGTIAYDLDLENTLPADFELVGDETIGNESLNAIASSITVNGSNAKIVLGTVDASSAEQTITKIIRLKAKTGVDYGTLIDGKVETNKINANWATVNGGSKAKTTTNDAQTKVREPKLVLDPIIASNTEFNNSTNEITLTLPVKNTNKTMAYNGSFKLTIPTEFEVVSGSISDSGVYDGTDGKHQVTWTGIDIASETTKNFTVNLKLKSDNSAGAGKKNNKVEFSIISYDSKEDTNDLTPKTYKPTDKKEVSLSIAPVTITKIVDPSTVQQGTEPNKYVRPGDTITYKIEITVPNNTTAYNLSFKDVLGVEQEIVSIKKSDGTDITTGSNNVFYELGNLTEGTHTITVISKVKTATNYNSTSYNSTNKASIEWYTKTGKNSIDKIGPKDATATIWIKQPSLTLELSNTGNISTQNATSKVTITPKNTVNTPAYNLKIVAIIPAELDVDESTITDGGVYDSNTRTITWENLLDNTIKPSFDVKPNVSSKANTSYTVETELKRYRTTPDDNPDSNYDGKIIPSNVKSTTSITLIGSHTLSVASPKEKDGKASEVMSFKHTLTNTGAGKDTYDLTKSGDYTTIIKDNMGNVLTQVTLEAGASIELYYIIDIPKSAPKGEDKTHTIISKSQSKAEQTNSQQDKVTVIGIDYNGNTFDGITAPIDNVNWQNGWTKQTFAPGQLIDLKALTSHDIDSVIAKIKVVGAGGGYIGNTDTIPVQLTKMEDGKWEASYRLPETLSIGEYFIEYYSYNSSATPNEQDVDKEESTMASNNYFAVAKPELKISLTPKETTVVSNQEVILTLQVDNSQGLTDAYGVVPKVTLPEGVEFVTVTEAVYGSYKLNGRDLEFYVGENTPYTLSVVGGSTTGSAISIEFKVKTNTDLSANEELNFLATTGGYYTAIDVDGNPILGTVQLEKTTSALLKTDTITFNKKVLSTTNVSEDYVRPGDQIIYQIDIGIPPGLSIHNLNIEDIVGDTLDIEKVVVNGVEYLKGNHAWKNLSGSTTDQTILVYTKVKDNVVDNIFMTTSTATVKWESKYTKDNEGNTIKKEDSKTITIDGKRPNISLDSFTSDKTSLENPGEEIFFTGKIRNNGTSKAHKTKIVAKLPDGTVPVPESYGEGVYDKNSNTITWVYDLNLDEEKTPSFKVKADDNRPIGITPNVELELVEYFSTEHEDNTTRYTGTKEEITLNTTRGHAIANTHNKEAQAGETVELQHILTNNGGSYDEYAITVDADLPYEIYVNGNKVTNGTKIPLSPGQSADIKIIVKVPETESKNVNDEKHIITLTAKGENSTTSHNAQDIIKIVGEELDGWVSNTLWSKWEKDKYRANWQETTYYLGSPLKVSAISTIDITAVRAEIWKIDGSGNKGSMVKQLELEIFNGKDTKSKFKLWENTSYVLENLEAGRYFIEYKAYKNGLEIENDSTLTTNSTELGYNNYFTVKSEVHLEGTIRDKKDNQPVEGAVVTVLDLSGKPVKDKDGKGYAVIVGADGKYHFQDVPINRYILEVKHDKYSEYSKQIFSAPEPNKNVATIDAELIGFIIELRANPSTIVGDGKSLTVLTTKVLDEEGTPVEGVEVVFDAPIGKLLGEPNDPKKPDKDDIKSSNIKGITNEKGEAYMLYQSEKIEGIVSQIIPVTATVNDIEKGLHGQDSIYITFEPASIKGVVTEKVGIDSNGNPIIKPVEGSKVVVSKTFVDGTTFYSEAITGPDGIYKIAIPKGNVEYDVEIIKSMTINKGTVKEETIDVSFNQKAYAEEVSAAKKDEEFPATKTYTGIIITTDKDGVEKIAGKGVGELPIKIKEININGSTTEKTTVDQSTGVFIVEDLVKGQPYEFVMTTEVDGKEILMGKLTVTLDDDGEININEELIDPYGTITDSRTGSVLGGVHVELFFADTPRNAAKGYKPKTSVPLPKYTGFAPSDNDNPQWSTSNLVFNAHPSVNDHGNYAWMVFSEADYYIVGTKSGYETYKSPIISVEFDIVKHDFEMTPIPSSGGGGYVPPKPVPTPPKPEEPKPDNTPTEVAVSLFSNRRSYLEETELELDIDYINRKGNSTDVELVVTIPKGAMVIDTNGGTIVGDTIVWKLGDLKDGDTGTKKPIIKLPQISSSEEAIILNVKLISDGKPIGEPSTIKVTVFSNRFGNGEHSRYIQGYPDGEFKPDKSITRAEIAVIFARILRLEDLVKNQEIYKDVKIGSWYARGVEAATGRGLFEGYNDGNFRPDQPITRAELAAVIGRFLELTDGAKVRQAFKDIEGHWALNYIQELYRNNVITGYTDGTFKPQAKLKRSEAVTMINRMLNRGPLKGVESTFPDVGKEHWANGDVEESTRSHEYYRNQDASETHLRTFKEDLNF